MAEVILNLTQHAATDEQVLAGVVALSPTRMEKLKHLLNFEEIPSVAELEARAYKVAILAVQERAALRQERQEIVSDSNAPISFRAMIGGAPYFMAFLENALKAENIQPVYAFSRRESVEQTQPDGTVKKITVFKHAGWVKV